MKRKLLNGLLLATALVSVGTFQSCKDYEADLQNEWRQQNYTLEEEVALLKNRVGELERIQALCQQNCDRKIQEILNMIGYWNTADRGTITENIKEILSRLTALEDNSMTEDELRDYIYKVLIERGWKAGEDGKPQYIDIPGLQDQLLDTMKDVANMQVKIDQLQKEIDYLNSLDINNRLAQIEDWILHHRQGISAEEARAIAYEEAKKAIDAYKLIVQGELSSLRSYIDTQDGVLQQQIDNMLTTIGQLDTRLTKAETDAINALNQANENKAAIEALQTLVAGLQGAIDATNERVDQLQGDVNENTKAIQALQVKVLDLEERLSKLETEYAELDRKFGELSQKVDTMGQQVDTNKTNIDNILQALTKLASKEDLDALEKRVAANETAIKALQGDVLKLFNIYNRLNKMVTGIIVQRVFNPLFGTFSLPLGIQSNMLVNYYGQYDGVQDLVFPSQTATTTRPMLTAEELHNLGSLVKPITIKNGEILMDGNMGKVYMTINPSNVALDGVQLTMESSNGTSSYVELQNVHRSSENLTFGVSRAADNGFYEADAVLPLSAVAINNTNLKLDPNLKSAVEDILKERSKANVFNLLKAIYGQLNQDLPAYALKTSWTVNDGQGDKTYNVLSNYEIAAVTFRPLSYNTYAGQSIDHQFSHRGPLRDVKDMLDDMISNDRFHFKLDATVNIDGDKIKQQFTFKLHDVKLEWNDNMEITGTAENVEIYDDNGNLVGHTGKFSWKVGEAEMSGFIDEVNYQFNNTFLPQWNQQLKENFDKAIDELVNQVNVEVNRALGELEVNINDQIDKILDDLKNDIAGKTQGIVDKLNKFLDKYNQAIDKLNDFMADPNHYLQVAMIYYTGKGDFHRLSTDRKDPSILNPAGGNGVELIATSYTAEVAAPAYKKFVAISAAWDKNGNALSPSEIQALNGGSLCQVLTGRAKRVALPTGKMKSGYTYQIVYTAVDFHGYTSVERYYVRMK